MLECGMTGPVCREWGDGSHRMSRSVLSLALSTLCTLAQSFKKKKL